MSAARALAVINNWNTVRCELLNTRICDLGLKIENSPVERYVRKIHKELTNKGFRFQPKFYLSDSWGCPDRVPVVGIPFYLADDRLAQIEEEQTGEIEDDQAIMMILRHEVGHAINYAYHLWKDPSWVDLFGPFTKAYRDVFHPNPYSRDFVRHLSHDQYGRNYAQKHPDEDFAETFAVWLTPRSDWRRRYRLWPAFRKLQYVDTTMRSIRRQKPKCTGGKLWNPVEELTILVAEHYGQRAERYRATAQGYVDDRLRELFPPTKGKEVLPATALIDRNRDALKALIVKWSPLRSEEVEGILEKLRDRAEALRLTYRRRDVSRKGMELGTLATSLAMDFAYTGRFTG